MSSGAHGSVVTQSTLMEHQQGDVEFIRREERVLLANEPGTGKSRSAIEATDGAESVLVVAPGLVLDSGNWEDEITRWAPDRAPTFALASYSVLNDRIPGSRGGHRPVKRLRPELRRHWDAVILDEAHYIKGRDSFWTWAAEQITKDADLVAMMTGTPIPNWAHEIYMPLRIMHPHETRRGTGRYASFWRWAEEWFDCTPTRWSGGRPVAGELAACTPQCLRRPATDPCSHYRDFTEANLGSRYRRVLRSQCLDLPPVTYRQVRVPLDKGQRSAYAEMRRHFMTEINGQEVLSWHKGARHVMLDRITTSPWLLAPRGEPTGGKLERLRHDLKDRTRQTVVFGHYVDTVEACATVARSVGATAAAVHGKRSAADNARAVRAFKEGRLDVLAASLELVAEGLTLTCADMAIFVEVSYKPYRNTQARYRIDRLGQTRPVTILEYIAPGTVDEGKRKLLAVKTDRQMRHLTAADLAEIT